MKNITVAVTDDAHRAARVWAAQRGTSISRVVQYVLSTLPTFPPANSAFPLPPQHAGPNPSPPSPAAAPPVKG